MIQLAMHKGIHGAELFFFLEPFHSQPPDVESCRCRIHHANGAQQFQRYFDRNWFIPDLTRIVVCIQDLTDALIKKGLPEKRHLN